MQKLEPQNQIHISEATIAIFLEQYAIFSFTFAPIDEGIANTSLRIESNNKKYVLRIYAQERKNDDAILFEIRFQDYLRERGIPIPFIYPTVGGKELSVVTIDGKRWQGVLMEFVEGESVTEHPSPELTAQLAGLQAKIHQLGIEFAKNTHLPHVPWPDLHDSLAVKIKTIPAGGPQVEAFIERVKAYKYPLNPDLPHGYNHLDIDFDGNVLTKDNHVKGIVDFDDLSYSPSIVCLGFSLWNILDDQGEEAMRHYLAEYEKTRPLTVAERRALPHVIFFRNYVIAIVRLLLWEEETDKDDIENILELEKRIPTLFHV